MLTTRPVLLWLGLVGCVEGPNPLVIVPRTDPPLVTEHPCDVIVPSLAPAPPVERSWPFLVSANGFTSVRVAVDARGVPERQPDGTVLSEDVSGAVITWLSHPAHEPAAGQITTDLLDRIAIGLRVGTTSTWLDEHPVGDSHYEPGTGIAVLEWDVSQVHVTARIFAPMTAHNDLAVVVEARNDSATPQRVEVWGLDDVHPGGELATDGERVSLDMTSVDTVVVESREQALVRHAALTVPVAVQAGPGDPGPIRDALLVGADLDGVLTEGDDVVVGMQWRLGELMPGEEASTGWVLSYTDDDPVALATRQSAWVADPATVLAVERADWKAWHDAEVLPPAPDADRIAVALQASATLRMSQVRVEGAGRGALLASPSPGGRNRMVTRDAAHAIAALVALGHQQPARDALQFLLDSDTGAYEDDLGVTYGIPLSGTDGEGVEGHTPQACPGGTDAGIEAGLDALGLTLWAWSLYADRWPGDPWVDDTEDLVVRAAAEPLIALIQPNNLLVADSSGWGRHWFDCPPHGRKQFVYGAIVASDGLRRLGARTLRDDLEDAAHTLALGPRGPADGGGPVVLEADGEELCPVILTAPEETCEDCFGVDALTTEVLTRSLIEPDNSLSLATLERVVASLALPDRPGLLRTDDAAEGPALWADLAEWVPADLRVAQALDRAAEHDPTLAAHAEALVSWVTAAARANADVVPERLSDGVVQPEDDQDRFRPGEDLGREVQGAVPLTGLGAGAYLLALHALSG